ncbi:MAG: hypothetical protein IPP77_11305 [Bacteroidetes bacterium]|nr:hypothetical protein [Bacteroidota bacterium]
MNELVTKTEALIKKAKKLSERYQASEEANRQLKMEIEALKNSIEAEKGKADGLKNELKIVKLARSIQPGTPDEDANITELKRKINEYIREIDSCIAMLND